MWTVCLCITYISKIPHYFWFLLGLFELSRCNIKQSLIRFTIPEYILFKTNPNAYLDVVVLAQGCFDTHP